MSTTTAAKGVTTLTEEKQAHKLSWQTLLMWAVVLGLFIAAIGMRLYHLGFLLDRDSYDEGVYWQSLRAMSAGYSLYQQIFYSQPPFFLLSIYPFFVLFGGTLWSARIGIAIISLLGLVGMFLLGKALRGRPGAIVALLLLVVSPLYLMESQTLQAEIPSITFSLLAVGLAYLWWERPEGRAGLCYAVLTGITLSLSILCKLLAVANLVPIGLLVLARLWQIWRKRKERGFASSGPIFAGLLAFVVTTLVILLPFFSVSQSMVQGVITFHTDAATVLSSNSNINAAAIYSCAQGSTTGVPNGPGCEWFTNLLVLQPLLVSLLSLSALLGTLVAFSRRDWRVIPLLGWFLATIVLLIQQIPLFNHHLAFLVPPLIALTVMGIDGSLYKGFSARQSFGPSGIKDILSPVSRTLAGLLMPLMILLTVVVNVVNIQLYYQSTREPKAVNVVRQDLRVAADLRKAITPDQLVVTDAQFVAALADRSTPPSLVDTSAVRLATGYITVQQLISEAAQPKVHAVLFYSDRFLKMPDSQVFYDWVEQHFVRFRVYGHHRELWIR